MENISYGFLSSLRTNLVETHLIVHLPSHNVDAAESEK